MKCKKSDFFQPIHTTMSSTPSITENNLQEFIDRSEVKVAMVIAEFLKSHSRKRAIMMFRCDTPKTCEQFASLVREKYNVDVLGGESKTCKWSYETGSPVCQGDGTGVVQFGNFGGVGPNKYNGDRH